MLGVRLSLRLPDLRLVRHVAVLEGLRQRGATRLRQLHSGPRAGQEAHGAEQHPRPRGVYMPDVQHGGRGDAPEAGRGGAQPQRDAAVRGREPGQGSGSGIGLGSGLGLGLGSWLALRLGMGLKVGLGRGRGLGLGLGCVVEHISTVYTELTCYSPLVTTDY